MAAKKTQTLKEFQAWLEGIEEVQPKGWSPDKSQWTKIRNRIKNIVEDVLPAPAPRLQQQPMPMPMPTPTPFMPPPTPSFIPADVDISPAAKAMLAGGKTPDLDTSDGSVDSLFE